jgi:anti-sigma factor RsiW
VLEIIVTTDLAAAACESEAARLLPWLVTGRLGVSDAERVKHHLEHCAICRGDLAQERRIRTAIKSDGPIDYAPQAGLARTLQRIDELARGAAEQPVASGPPRTRHTERRRLGINQWLAAAAIVQAIGLGAIGASFLNRMPDAGRYETRSAASPVVGEARIRAVFKPTMTLGELRTLLIAQRLRIVAGPSESGVFTLATSDAIADRRQLDTILGGLRSDARVLFAEPASDDRAAVP